MSVSDQDDAAILAILARDDPKVDTSAHAAAMLMDALSFDKLFDASAKHILACFMKFRDLEVRGIRAE